MCLCNVDHTSVVSKYGFLPDPGDQSVGVVHHLGVSRAEYHLRRCFVCGRSCIGEYEMRENYSVRASANGKSVSGLGEGWVINYYGV